MTGTSISITHFFNSENHRDAGLDATLIPVTALLGLGAQRLTCKALIIIRQWGLHGGQLIPLAAIGRFLGEPAMRALCACCLPACLDQGQSL
jgi:hypothetical protein